MKTNTIKKAYRIVDGKVVETISAVRYFTKYISKDKTPKGILVCASCFDNGKEDVELYVHNRKSKETVRFNRKSSKTEHHEECDVLNDTSKKKEKTVKKKDTPKKKLDVKKKDKKDTKDKDTKKKVDTKKKTESARSNIEIDHFDVLEYGCEYAMGDFKNIPYNIEMVSLKSLNIRMSFEPIEDIQKEYGDRIICLYGKIDRVDNKPGYKDKMYIMPDYTGEKTMLSIRIKEKDKKCCNAIEEYINNLKDGYEPVIALIANLRDIKVLNNGKNINIDINTMYQSSKLMIAGNTIADIYSYSELEDKYKKKTYSSFIEKGIQIKRI